MKQLTDPEKREIETKIKDEQERQQTLREKYPNPPENSKFKGGISDNRICVKQSLEIRFSLDHSLSSCFLCVYLFQVAEF